MPDKDTSLTTDRQVGLAILKAIAAASNDEDIGGGILRLLRNAYPGRGQELEDMAIAAGQMARTCQSGADGESIAKIIQLIEEQTRQAAWERERRQQAIADIVRRDQEAVRGR